MNDIRYLIQMKEMSLFHRKKRYLKDLIEVLKSSATSLCKHTIKEKNILEKTEYSYVVFSLSTTIVLTCSFIFFS